MSIEALQMICAKCRGNEWVPETPRKEILAWFHDFAAAAIEQAERQEPVPLVNIELSRRMAAVKVSNFYGSIIKDAEKEIQRLHGLVLQHTAPRQPLTEEEMLEILVGIDAETKRLPPGMKAFARAIERAHGIGGEK